MSLRERARKCPPQYLSAVRSSPSFIAAEQLGLQVCLKLDAAEVGAYAGGGAAAARARARRLRLVGVRESSDVSVRESWDVSINCNVGMRASCDVERAATSDER